MVPGGALGLGAPQPVLGMPALGATPQLQPFTRAASQVQPSPPAPAAQPTHSISLGGLLGAASNIGGNAQQSPAATTSAPQTGGAFQNPTQAQDQFASYAPRPQPLQPGEPAYQPPQFGPTPSPLGPTQAPPPETVGPPPGGAGAPQMSFLDEIRPFMNWGNWLGQDAQRYAGDPGIMGQMSRHAITIMTLIKAAAA